MTTHTYAILEVPNAVYAAAMAEVVSALSWGEFASATVREKYGVLLRRIANQTNGEQSL